MLANAFNYVAGLASIVSLILALGPFFEKYRQHFRYATIFCVGVLMGSVFASVSASTIVIQFEGSITQMLLLGGAATAATILLSVIVGIALGGEVKEFHGTAGLSAAGVFFMMMVMYGVAHLGSGSSSPSYRGRDVDELLSLARYYNGNGIGGLLSNTTTRRWSGRRALHIRT